VKQHLVIHDQLTARLLGVARLVAEGKTDQQIADELHIARRTANAHVQRIASAWGLARTKGNIRVQIARRVASWNRAA